MRIPSFTNVSPPIFNGTLPHKTSMIRVRPLKAAIIWQIFDGVGWVGINLKNPFLWGIPKTKNDMVKIYTCDETFFT